MTEITEIRTVIKFFVSCGLTNGQIHEWLEKGFGYNAVTLRTVETWAARFRAGRTSVEDDVRSGRPTEDGRDALILSHIEENPNASTRSMSDALGIPLTSVYRILTQLHFQYFKCKWVPHRLSDDQKFKRVERSKELLEKLGPMSDRQLANVITEDESWFFFSNGSDGQWRLCLEDVDQNVSHTIGSKKLLISVFWGTRSFHLIEALPDGGSFTSDYLCDDLLQKLQTVMSVTRPVAMLRGLWIHWDNGKPHVSEKTSATLQHLGLKKLPHPPYSPDIAPSDFYLFGRIKGMLAGKSFGSREELLSEVMKITQMIPRDELCRVYEEWKRRLVAVIESGGEYITN